MFPERYAPGVPSASNAFRKQLVSRQHHRAHAFDLQRKRGHRQNLPGERNERRGRALIRTAIEQPPQNHGEVHEIQQPPERRGELAPRRVLRTHDRILEDTLDAVT